MSDYTPTTEGIREAYASQVLQRTEETDPTVPGAEFDRWMAEVRASVLAEQGEPEWAEEWIAYANITPSGLVLNEYRGLNYSTHHRTVKAGPWEWNVWLPVEENGENDG